MEKKPVDVGPDRIEGSPKTNTKVTKINYAFRPFRIPYPLMAYLYKSSSDLGLTVDETVAQILAAHLEQSKGGRTAKD